MITNTYVIDNRAEFAQVAINLADGRTILVHINIAHASLLMQPDERHYPAFMVEGAFPDTFTPY